VIADMLQQVIKSRGAIQRDAEEDLFHALLEK
jgi:hypothetical protein